MDIKQLCNLIDSNKQELFELLSSLVKINSENHTTYGNEEEIAKYVYKICQDLGLESEIYSPMDIPDFKNHPDYMDGRNLENRYNVTAKFKGAQDINELMIMGHSDTVPIGDGNNWDKNPLSGEISDGKIYGRGACDDKYAIATALFLIKLLKDNGFTPKKNLLFTAYCDEEIGGSHGALASSLKYPCNRVVNMDGRINQVWHCASGGQDAKFLFHAKGTVNSADITAKAIPIILEVMEKFKANRESELSKNPFYKGTIIPTTSLRYMGIKVGNAGNDLGNGEIHFTYYTDKTKEHIYGIEFPELEKEISKRLEPLGLECDGFKPHTRFFHYTFVEPNAPEILEFSDAMQEAIGKRPQVCGSCLSDLSVIGKFGGKCAFAYGAGKDFSLPGGPHQPNEFIDCDVLVEFAKTIGSYIIKVLN